METRFSNLRTQFKKITLGVGHVYVIEAMQPATIFTHVIFPCNVKNTFLLHKAYAARHVVRQLLIKHLPWPQLSQQYLLDETLHHQLSTG